MTPSDTDAMFRNLDTRMARIEQILPTLATRDDLRAFATKELLTAEISALEARLGARIDDVSRQARVLHEDAKSDIRLVAEHLAYVSRRVDHASQRVDDVSERVEYVSQRVEHVSQRVDHVSQRVDHVSQRVEHVSEHLEHVSKNIDHVSERLDHVTQVVDRLDRRQ